LKISLDYFRLARILAISGKTAKLRKEISISTMSPYFNATEHRAHQPRVVTAGSMIVFSMNLSGITGIFPIVINENTGSMKEPIRTDKCQTQQY
jgi:hypothetical protein